MLRTSRIGNVQNALIRHSKLESFILQEAKQQRYLTYKTQSFPPLPVRSVPTLKYINAQMTNLVIFLTSLLADEPKSNKTLQITPLRIGESFPLLRKEPCQAEAPLRI